MIKTFQSFNFRNLSDASIELGSDISLFIGENGSGKTSLLEAFYTLANGKSFRTNKTQSMINIDSSAKEFVLRAECQVDNSDIGIGLRKGLDEKYIAKVGSERVESIADLARVIPTQVVEPKSFHLFSQGASNRRRFMDWGLFHVEHSYSSTWRQYIKCLKQRNSLLRSGKLDADLFKVWDNLLVSSGDQLHRYRSDYFEVFFPIFWSYLEKCFAANVIESLEVRYFPGWDNGISFHEALEKSWVRDTQKRSSQVGPHRSDLKFVVKGLPIEQALSRGQQKLTILCCHLAAVSLVNQVAQKKALLLLDDISSELDEDNLRLAITELCSLDTQVVMSGIDLSLFQRVLNKTEFDKRVKMFHVEHGRVSTIGKIG